ncbi:MAG: PAS domain-containing protein, partial [Thermoplasmata archaeon]|nr:PAS domain-containing protein [Thermoplasmata archaeon]
MRRDEILSKITIDEREIIHRLKWMTLIRLGLACTLLLTAAVVTGSRYLYLFTGFCFTLSAVHALALLYSKKPRFLAYVQILLDLLLITFLISITGADSQGPATNLFVLLYIIPIVAASLFFDLSQVVAVAVVSSALYVAVVILRRLTLGDYGQGYQASQIFYILYTHVITFGMVGFLCGSLANSLKRKREELSELKTFHNLILTNMNSGLISTSEADEIVFANRAAEEIMGFNPGQMVGKHVRDFFDFAGSFEEDSCHEISIFRTGDIKKSETVGHL